MTVQRDALVVQHPALRRERVRAFLAFLLLHRETTRAAAAFALWPDFDERSAGNNLRVTLNHLIDLLEPERGEGEAPFFVRSDGTSLVLVTREVTVDVDRFENLIASARAHEGNGAPSLALPLYVEAAELYRGELFADVSDAEWLDLAREQARSRFVTSAVRAAQLLAAMGEVDLAMSHAQRALETDPWSEDAYGVLVEAALLEGDRSSAGRLLSKCSEMLNDLGLSPSRTTERLRRKLEET
jgi:DNA-binding SARP family transcriptional activator